MSLLAACSDEGNPGPVAAADLSSADSRLTTPYSDAAPIVDPAALQDLGEQLNSAAVAQGFARDYAQMWDRRYHSLAGALERRDQAAALDAVLSLKTSSSMVGGLRLAELAGELEDAIRGGDLGRAASLLGDVAARGSETVDELQFSYILWER